MKNIKSKLLASGIGMITGIVYGNRRRQKQLDLAKDYGKKMSEFYHLLVQWLSIKQEGNSIAVYFEEQGYKTVAIYGMKELGERLYAELKETDIIVKFGIDKNVTHITENLRVVKISDITEKVDVVVVTAIHYYADIATELSKIVNCPIVSLEEIICYF